MLQAINLSKTYNGTTALHALNLSIQAGEIFCLLGANGAGKTTTINIFMGFTEPTSGEALVNGIQVHSEKPNETKKFIAYIPENVMLYPTLTGLENLAYLSGLSGATYSNIGT
jgi:ABC-2 type transport system ATP-binding protein